MASIQRAMIEDVEVVEVNRGDGVWNARNEGIKRSTGEWLIFVDGDDEVSEDWFKLVRANENNGDLILARLAKFAGEEDWRQNKGIRPFPGYWQACAYKRSILPPEGFPPYVYGEDQLFFLRCMNRSTKVVDVDKVVYGYRQHQGSAVWRKPDKVKFLSRRDYAYYWLKESKTTSSLVARDATWYLTFDLFLSEEHPWKEWYEGLERLKEVAAKLPWRYRVTAAVCRVVKYHWVTWALMYVPARISLKYGA